MKKVYPHENLTLVHAARNLLQLQGIECAIKNDQFRNQSRPTIPENPR